MVRVYIDHEGVSYRVHDAIFGVPPAKPFKNVRVPLVDQRATVRYFKPEHGAMRVYSSGRARAVIWFAPRKYRTVHEALEHLRTDPDLPAGGSERAIVIDNWAAMLMDVVACNENGGSLAVRASAQREHDALAV